MNIFLSLSERMCLMKAQPVPMRAIVMNRRAPFSLKEKQIVQGDYFVLLPGSFSPTDSKATNPNKCLAICKSGKCLSYKSEADVFAYNCAPHSNITLHSQLSIQAIFSWGSHPFTIMNRRKHWQLHPLTIHTKCKLDTWILVWIKNSKAFLLLLLYPQNNNSLQLPSASRAFPLTGGWLLSCHSDRSTKESAISQFSLEGEGRPHWEFSFIVWIYQNNLLIYLQVSDIIDNSPAFNRKSLRRNVVIVDLEAENTTSYFIILSSAPHPWLYNGSALAAISSFILLQHVQTHISPDLEHASSQHILVLFSTDQVISIYSIS